MWGRHLGVEPPKVPEAHGTCPLCAPPVAEGQVGKAGEACRGQAGPVGKSDSEGQGGPEAQGREEDRPQAQGPRSRAGTSGWAGGVSAGVGWPGPPWHGTFSKCWSSKEILAVPDWRTPEP